MEADGSPKTWLRPLGGRAVLSSAAAAVLVLTQVARADAPPGAPSTPNAPPAPSTSSAQPAPDPSSSAAPADLPPFVKPWGPRLEYTSSPGCPDEEAFHHAVASYIEGAADPFDPASLDLLRITLQKVPGGHRGSVQKVPAGAKPWPPQERTGATCAEVFRDLARLASMRVPERPKAPSAPAEPEPTPAPPPSPPSPPPSDPVVSPPSRVAPASDAHVRLPPPPPPPTDPMDLTIALHTAFVLTAGFSDNVGPAFQLGASARHDWETVGVSLGLEVRGVLPSGVVARAIEDAPPGSSVLGPQPFDLSQLSAQLVPCLHFAKYFAGCGVVQGFLLLTDGPAFDLSTQPGWGLGPRFGFEIPFAERFAAFGFAEALFPFVRPGTFFSDPPDGPKRVWDQSVVSGFFGAGVAVKFK